MAVRKLAVSQFAHHRVRTFLTVAAVALAVSLVVSVTSGYASAEAAIYRYYSQYMGTTDLQIFREDDTAKPIAESRVKELRKQPEVQRVDGRFETSGLFRKDETKPDAPARAAVIGIRRPGDNRSDYMRFYEGAWFDTPDGDVAVIDQATAEYLQVKVGDEIRYIKSEGELKLKVVGIVHKPSMLAPYTKTVYLPLQTLQRFVGQGNVVSRVMVDLKTGVDDAKFAAKWKKQVEGWEGSLRVRTARETRRTLQNNLRGVHALSYMGGTISLLAATFIVFSALSMGVTERQRTLAMLRAIGAHKSQVAKLVVSEALLLAAVGAAVGVPLGWAWINLLAWWYADLNLFSAGVTLSTGGVLLGTLGTLAAALGASLLPAWSASRVDPLEAMTPLSQPPSKKAPIVAAILGIFLISLDPLIMFGPIESIVRALGVERVDDTTRVVVFYAHFGIGLPGLMIGFFLLSPMFVWLCERVVGPIVAAMFGLRFSMLRQQLSTGLWRVAGTCSALMVGLAVLVVLQINGATFLRGWVLPTKFPDIFIMSTPFNGITEEQVAMLETVPGIKKGEVLPIAIALPRYTGAMKWIGMASLLPNATMFIGVEPDRAFTMMGLDFREGTPEEAARLLKQGDHVVITAELQRLKNLHVGDKLPLSTSQGDREFTIAGVVWSPGIDVMVTMFDMERQMDQRTANSLFGSLADAKKYFGVNEVDLFAANIDPDLPREQMLANIEKHLGRKGMTAADVRHIKVEIEKGLSRLLMLVSTVALAAMAVSSLGVTNTIMASIRTRRWQFGVMRSIGVTRSQLLRLVLAEAMLIGIVGCVLGLCAGFLMAIDANALSGIVVGYKPKMFIPWTIVWTATGAVAAISLLASLWPAIIVAKTEPLDLLQAGRAAA